MEKLSYLIYLFQCPKKASSIKFNQSNFARTENMLVEFGKANLIKKQPQPDKQKAM